MLEQSNGRPTQPQGFMFGFFGFAGGPDQAKAFVGDIEEWRREEGRQWGGDEVIVETKSGSVKIMYDDEAGFAADGAGDEDHSDGGGGFRYGNVNFGGSNQFVHVAGDYHVTHTNINTNFGH